VCVCVCVCVCVRVSWLAAGLVGVVVGSLADGYVHSLPTLWCACVCVFVCTAI